MPIDIRHLEDELARMTAAEAPGREFCRAVAELAEQERFHELEAVLPAAAYAEMEGALPARPRGLYLGLARAGGRDASGIHSSRAAAASRI